MSERERRRFRYHREQEVRDGPPQDEQPEQVDHDAAVRRRIDQQAQWVDLQVRAAIERGEFDNLPGAGKPIRGLDPAGTHDPDWWLKQLIAREQVSGVLPPALALRKEDAELEAQIDREPNPESVRTLVEEFNRRVVEARRQLAGGPPVVTPLRDVEAEIAAWQERRRARRAVPVREESPPRGRKWRFRRPRG